MSSRTTIILGILGVFLLLGAGYFFFMNADSGAAAVTASGPGGSSAEALFISLSGQLDTITFDTSVFSDPRFAALVDIHTPILPEAEGRTDPFASLGSNASTGP